jgi:hypothetical protein
MTFLDMCDGKCILNYMMLYNFSMIFPNCSMIYMIFLLIYFLFKKSLFPAAEKDPRK